MTRTLDYLRRNALAALALVCSLLSLAGASYAAHSACPPAASVPASYTTCGHQQEGHERVDHACEARQSHDRRLRPALGIRQR